MVGVPVASVGDDGGVTDTRTDRTSRQSTDTPRERSTDAAGSSWTPLANPSRTRRS